MTLQPDTTHLIDPDDPSKIPKRTFFKGRYKTTEFEDGSAIMEVGAHLINTILLDHPPIDTRRRRKPRATKGL